MSHRSPSQVSMKPVTPPAAHWRAVRRVAQITLSPLRLFLSIRRSLTAASVSLLLIGIVTVNIVWGYPWIGLFSACASLMFVGWTMNNLMRPNLGIDFSLANSSPVGQPFSVVIHLKNRSRLPAMDVRIGFDAPGPRRRKGRDAVSLRRCRVLSPPKSMTLIRPGARADLQASVAYDRRGIHRLPDVVVTSLFPFHLFRATRRCESQTSIAITPRAMVGDEDAVSRGLLHTLGGWSHRLLSGDALDYTGSREYEWGMTVRRWDFASWARLGRPIVREFQSPSIQMIVLIVDMSLSDTMPSVDTYDDCPMERVLSLAATAVADLTRKMVGVRLYVTSEDPSLVTGMASTQSLSDRESLLIRLAAAASVDPREADDRVRQVLDHVGRCPVLVLTARPDFRSQQDVLANVTILRVDPAVPAPAISHQRRRRNGLKRTQAVTP